MHMQMGDIGYEESETSDLGLGTGAGDVDSGKLGESYRDVLVNGDKGKTFVLWLELQSNYQFCCTLADSIRCRFLFPMDFAKNLLCRFQEYYCQHAKGIWCKRRFA